MPLDPCRVKELFVAALDLSGSQEREAFLDGACGADAELRGRLAVLLKAHREPAPVLNQPLAAGPADAGATASQQAEVGTGPTRHHPAEEAGTVLGGRYTLLEPIGQGGMGEVWLAGQSEPVRRTVAIKLIKAGMDSKSVLARFEAERQALAVMDHAGIAKVLDGGTTAAGRPFFVMEYVKGVPLTQYCDEARLTVRQRLALFGDVCSAVQHAHQKGVIHRDLKPSNILVAPSDGRPAPKVIDFGLAKAMHEPLTEHTLHTAHGLMLGTPLYMSPEQAELNNLDVDTRTDIYSLGVILYELLTGTTPLERQRFRDASWSEVMRVIKEEDPPRPSARLSGSGGLLSVAERRQAEPRKLTKLVRGELDWIVMKCLEKERGRRYETANGLAMDLRRYLSGEPVLAVPPSAGYRLRKFLRRNRGAVVAAGLVLLALAAGLAGTAAGLVRATDAAARERLAREGEAEQRQKAELNLEEARAISRHLTRMLGELKDSPRPGAKSEEITIRELLDQAARDVGTSFAGRPKLEAAIRHTIGENYEAISALVPAREQLETALRLRETHLGPDHPDTIETVFRLARCCHTAGMHPDAERLYRRVIAARSAALGRGHPDTFRALRHLSGLCSHMGQFARAEPLLQEAQAGLAATLGPDHADTLEAQMGVAQNYRLMGRWELATPAYDKLHQAQVAALGPDHPYTLLTVHDLALGCLHRNEQARAEVLLNRAIDGMSKAYGPRHVWALQFQETLAKLYFKQGRFDAAADRWQAAEEGYASHRMKQGQFRATLYRAAACWAAGKRDVAVPLFRRALKAQEDRLGGDHPNTNITLDDLAQRCRAAGRPELVVALYEQLVQVREARVGADHPDTARARTRLAAEYWAADRPEKAVPLLRSYLAGQKKKFGADDPRLAEAQAAVALSLLRHRQPAEAEAVLRECLAIREKKEPDAWTTFNTKSMLGGALLGQKKYAEAEPLLVEGYEGMERRQDKIPTPGKARLSEARDRLVQMYEATGKNEKADAWRKKRVAAQKTPPRSARP